jgi:hypothetical protein
MKPVLEAYVAKTVHSAIGHSDPVIQWSSTIPWRG